MIRDALDEGEQKETIMVGAGIWQRLKHFSDTNSNLKDVPQ